MNPKFMVVDDDEPIRALVSGILESMGCEVELHDNGESAVASLSDPAHAQQFDAVLLDVVMIGLSGLGVLERLRAMPHTANLPVLLLTARGHGDEVVEGYQLGASYYIQKPFTNAQLVYGLDLILGDGDQTPLEEGEKPIPVHHIDFNPDSVSTERPTGVPIPPQSTLPITKR